MLTAGQSCNVRYRAYRGDDRVNSRNGTAETVQCGTGQDRATVDKADTTVGCERVLRPR